METVETKLLNCIVQKILLAPKFKENTQRNKILRTRGTINNKLCNMIIDSGSNENTVSKVLVDVIGLSTEINPILYRIGYIKKGAETRVT